MFSIHGTSSILYISILETLQICTLHFMMNKVLVSIICLHYGLISTYGHQALSYSITNSNTESPTYFTEQILQIADHVSPALQHSHRTRFLQIAKHFAPNHQDISPISEQHTFFSVLFGKDPVSDPSLHVPWAPCSALWVVGCGSLVTPIPPTRPQAPRSTLWTMG